MFNKYVLVPSTMDLVINASLYFFFLFLKLLDQISCLAENTDSSIVFDEVLTAAGKDIISKDVTRIRGGWAMQDAFFVCIF
jgi:hypothetical protein